MVRLSVDAGTGLVLEKPVHKTLLVRLVPVGKVPLLPGYEVLQGGRHR
jgi:hypothetical protein